MKAIVAVLVVVLGATTAWLWFQQSLRLPGAETAQASAELQDDTDDSVVETAAADTDLEPEHSQDYDPKASPDSVMLREARASGSGSALERKLRHNAEYVETRRQFHRLMVTGRFPDIGRVLDLSPEVTDQLYAILSDHRARYGLPAVEESEIGPGEPELEQQEREYALKYAIAQSIGQSRMPRYEKYVASLYERYEVRGLQFELMNTRDALDFEAAEPVIGAMYDERQRIERELTGIHGEPDGGDHYPPEFVVDGKVVEKLNAGSNERIFAAAARHLTPDQAEAFQKSFDDVAELNRLGEEMRRIRSEARAGATRDK